MTVDVGLDGVLRLGDWTVASVEGVNGDDLSLFAADPAGQTVSYPLERDEASAGRFTGLFRLGQEGGTIEIVSGGAVVANVETSPLETAPVRTVRWDRPIWASDAGSELGELTSARIAEFDFEDSPVVLAVDTRRSGSDLIDRLATVDVLVLSQPPVPGFAVAVDRWVRRGGHLILSFGGEADDWTDRLGWSPVLPGEERTYRQLSALESAVSGGRRIDTRRGVRGVALSGDGNVVEIDSTQGPIVVRSAYGFGRVTGVAIDLTHPAIESWESLEGLGLLLTGYRISNSEERSRRGLTRTGVTEVETQLLASIDAADDGVRSRPGIWTLLGYLAGYAAIVGLLDYVLINRLLNRPQLTWFTMPVWVLLAFFAAASVQGAGADNVGESTQRLSVLDLDATTGTARGFSWASVGSDELKRGSIEAQQPMAASDWQVGWAAAPESNFGGLYRRGGTSAAGLLYESDAARHSLKDLPFRPNGTRLFRTDWFGERSEPMTVNLKAVGNRLNGTITNNLDVAISDWTAGFGGTLVTPWENEPLEPGETFEVNANSTRQSTLREAVTGTSISTSQPRVGSKKDVRTQTVRNDYDPTSTDVLRTLRIATFFDAAGGYDYAGVRASTPRGLDMTPLLRLDRLVLVGRVETDISPMTVFGESADSGEAFVRVAVPIRPPEVARTD